MNNSNDLQLNYTNILQEINYTAEIIITRIYSASTATILADATLRSDRNNWAADLDRIGKHV